MKGFSVIVAHDAERGIGLNNDLPWKLPQDLQNFKMLTTNSGDWLPPAVLMGSRTWESLPVKPLKDRVNAVVSNKYSYIKGATVFKGVWTRDNVFV